jgi:hypothetical protein
MGSLRVASAVSSGLMTAANRPPHTPRMRIVGAAEAIAGIRSGQVVFVHGGAATPSTLLDALVARAKDLRDVTSSTFTPRGPGRTSPPTWPRASDTARCSSDPTRARP